MTRELVLDLLMEWEKTDAFSHHLIRQVLDKYDYLSGQEKSFMKRLAEGTLERQIELDYVINQFSSVPVKKMKPLIRNLIRMSVYQILYMDAVPDAAAVSEAVKLANKRKFTNLKGFVNGVLRNISKSKGNISYPDKEKDIKTYLSVKYSMPIWLVEHWIAGYGELQTEQLLEGLLQIRPVTVRVSKDLSKAELEQWLEEVKVTGAKVEEHPYLPNAFYLYDLEGIGNLPGYEEGYFVVQDVSSMLAVEAAGLKEGDKVIDLCAAPGGKTMYSAEKVGKTGWVESRDLTEFKVNQILDNVERMGLSQVGATVWDARVEDPTLQETADVVIADLPCSGLGVMGKKRDIKYRMSPESMDSLVQLQKDILKVAVKYVKPGGVLLYSTCTIHSKENQEMANWIVDNFDFQLEDMTPYLPMLPKMETAADGYLQLLPGVHETDGFFFARLRRKTL
ncbi:MAG: 16S rRNA (cytosine(967)-C(5))-methyltransferase RsmB [Lachnospiraceae bacterium]|nr:16S rRNA (cytosine(967)-C(5))-methyltransferase RsmB [Lachnospiraceae bacterium]